MVSRDKADNSRRGDGSNVPTFSELMELHDEAFVRAAYLTVLHRPADSVGLSYYVGRLRAGHSRLAVLDQLARSPECTRDLAKPLRDGIAAFRASRGLRGWRVALSDAELGRTRDLRRARMLQNNMAAHRQRIEELLARLSTQQDVLMGMLSDLSAGYQSDESGDARGRRGSTDDVSETSEFRLQGRRVEDVRSADLTPAAKSVLDALRF